MKKIKTGDLTRVIELDRAALNEDRRTVEMSFSSEEPVERWFGDEVLSHSPESVRMSRLNDSAPLLWNHEIGDVIGVVENARIENGRGYATVRFSKSQRGEEVYQDVLDEIIKNVSVGYRIHEMNQVEDEGERFVASDWEPHEISMVSVPADQTVGVGRSKEVLGVHETRVITPEIKQETTMTEEVKTEVDVSAIQESARAEALQDERARNDAITKIAGQADYLRDLADEARTTGMSVAQFNEKAVEVAIAQSKRSQEQVIENNPARVDMTPKEEKRYSLFRAITAQASGDWTEAGFEREVHDDIAGRVGPSSQGFYLPTNIGWGKRDLTVGTDNAGGYLRPTDHMGDSFIENLKANMVTAGLGAQVMSGLSGNVAIPKIATGTTVYWVAEDGAPTEGQPVFAQLTMSPKNLAAYVQISRNLVLQSDPSVEAMVQDDISRAIAVAIDAAALAGSGSSNQPTGIISTTGIGSVSFSSGGAPTFAEIVSVESAITVDNAVTGDLNWVTHPTLGGTLNTTTKDSGSGRFVSEDGQILGYPVSITSSCTSGNIVLGSFNELIVGQWGAVEVITDRSATTGQLTLGLHTAVDIGVRHAEAFAKGA